MLKKQRLKKAESQARPWFDKLTMRFKLLKPLAVILSLSKDEHCFLAIS
jgi:hypothetical protein